MARKPGNKSVKPTQKKGTVRRSRAAVSGRFLSVHNSRPARTGRADDGDDDAQWDATSTRYADKLALLADKALAEFVAGRTTPIDPDTM